jgi:hypothetical protein
MKGRLSAFLKSLPDFIGYGTNHAGKLTILPFPLIPCLLGGKTGENNLRTGIWRLFGLVSLTGIF